MVHGEWCRKARRRAAAADANQHAARRLRNGPLRTSVATMTKRRTLEATPASGHVGLTRRLLLATGASLSFVGAFCAATGSAILAACEDSRDDDDGDGYGYGYGHGYGW